MKNEYYDIKKIISNFVKMELTEITENTVIDKSVIQGSILIHRMYAEFAELGYHFDNYYGIKTFGELIKRLNNENSATKELLTDKQSENFDSDIKENNIGIDIEKVSNFPNIIDYRENSFYKQNFSESEISHCLLQPNVNQSFAGLFAAKEAIVKANNLYKKVQFSKIEIFFDNLGKPKFKDFFISISHTDEYAVAVAFLPVIELKKDVQFINETDKKSNLFFWKLITLLSFFISLFLVLFLILTK